MQLVRCQAFASACASVRFRPLTTDRHPFFLLLSSYAPPSHSSHLTCYHLCRRHSHRHRTCRVLLAIIHAAGILTAILIDIVHVASYSLLSLRPASSLVTTSLMSFSLCRVSSGKLPFVTVTQSDAIYGDVVYSCTLDVMNITGLSHNAWNQMRV